MESKAFLRILFVVALSWLGLHAWAFHSQPRDLAIFLQVFWAVLLDLVFLILLFWELFFAPKPTRKLKVFVYFTFKLVCLAFLAITLKRLRNESPLPAAMAVLFMGIGPVAAAVLTRWKKGSKQ